MHDPPYQPPYPSEPGPWKPPPPAVIPPAHWSDPPRHPTGNGFATAALVCGCVGVGLGLLVFLFFLAFPLGVVAVVFGFSGRCRALRGAPHRGQATAGLVLGVIAIVLAVASLVLIILIADEVDHPPAGDPVPVEDYDLRAGACTQVGDGLVLAVGAVRGTGDAEQRVAVAIDVRRVGALEASGSQIVDLIPGQTTTYRVAVVAPGDGDLTCDVAVVVAGA